MKTLLMHEAAYGRVSAALVEFSDAVEVVRLADDGRLLRGPETLDADSVEPHAVWANADAFFSPAVRTFFVTTLKSSRLEWVQSGAAGFESPAFAAIVQKGAILTSQHTQAVGIADYVLWGVLDHLQRGPERRGAQAAKQWERPTFREVDGSTWLIVGFGAIGQGVAQRARGFGAKIVGVRRSAGSHPLADRMVADWREALPEADVVVFSVPLSPATKRLADASAFAAFKPGSVFVNVGRGGLVDEPALLAALDTGRPEHAVLDVFDQEPLAPESPFWTHPRVTLTAHCAGITVGGPARSDAVFLDNLRRYAFGEPLQEVVNPADVLAAQAG